MKRAVTLQDISCAGKCSITVALPVLSCLETETIVIPTSLLSNHTAFESYTAFDLSDKILALSQGIAHNNIRFDAIYTGYLGSKDQINEIHSFVERYRTDRSVFIADPAMADNGRLYSGLPDDFAQSMASLISIADVIIPNLTEACLLLGRDYRAPESYESSEIMEMLSSLASMGPGRVIITGVHSGPDSIGAMCFDMEYNRYSSSFRKKHEGIYLGTGDIFASVVTGCMLKDLPLEKAMENAVDFVGRCIEETDKDPEKRWYGVSFEKCLHILKGYIE